MDEAKLQRELNALSEKSQSLFNILIGEENGDYNSLLNQYKRQRAEILLEINKGFKIPKIADPILRKELKSFIKDGDKLISIAKKSKHEVVRNFGKVLEGQFKPEFDQKRLDDLELNYFYDKYNPTEYVYGLIETGSIIIKQIDFPEKLQKLIVELRECLILNRYLAAGIMLRTIIEVAINDIMGKNFSNDEFDHLAEKIGFLKNKSKYSTHAYILSKYLDDLNEFVHGKKLISSDEIKTYAFDIILYRVEGLYELSK